MCIYNPFTTTKLAVPVSAIKTSSQLNSEEFKTKKIASYNTVFTNLINCDFQT
jgi:hypothetical protein